MEKVGAYADIEKVKESRQRRTGKGAARNRRYVQRKGPLVIYKEDSGTVKAFRNLPGVETCCVERLNLLQLAPGGHIGRFVIWTRSAFESLDSLYGTQAVASKEKTDYRLPRAAMAQADLARLINSDEVQSVLQPKKKPTAPGLKKRNALKNADEMDKLNPPTRRPSASRKRCRACPRRPRRASRSRRRPSGTPSTRDRAWGTGHMSDADGVGGRTGTRK